MDNVSAETRTRTMRAVRSRDTSPELVLRRALRALGRRGYRVSPRSVPGVPDIAYTGLRIAVFVDGCYWHGCPQHCRRPSSNVDYWNRKIGRTIERDERTNELLRMRNWSVLRFWEHEIASAADGAAQRIVAEVEQRRSLFVNRRPGPAGYVCDN